MQEKREEREQKKEKYIQGRGRGEGQSGNSLVPRLFSALAWEGPGYEARVEGDLVQGRIPLSLPLLGDSEVERAGVPHLQRW